MKVSIIVPVYNVEPYLEKCLESLIGQSYKDLEIIVIDDCSTDNSRIICEKYAKKDSRIVFLKNKTKQGVVYTRGVGFEYANGEYISCVDADDWMELYAYEKVVNIIKSHCPDMLLFGYYKDYGTYTEQIKEHFSAGKYNLDELGKKYIGNQKFYTPFVTQSIWNKIVRTDLIKQNEKKVPRTINRYEDAMLAFSCLKYSKWIYVLDEYLYHYRNRKGSTLFINSEKDYKSFLACVKMLIELYGKYRLSTEENKKRFIDFVIFGLLLSSPERLFSFKNLRDGLLFRNMKIGDRIIIYGKGSFGTRINQEIRKNRVLNVIDWIDEKDKLRLLNICPNEYDFILIAVTYSNIVESIKMSLNSLNIPKDKILTLDDMNRSIDILPYEIRCLMESE